MMTVSDPLLSGKPDERRLWQAVLTGERPRDAGQRLGMHPKRVVAICEKWTRRRIYDYGVSPDLGWAERRADQ
jgi:hypothetical protein